jgi:hypothetical protein
MANQKSSGPRPLNVYVKPGSKAELSARQFAAKQKVAPKPAPPQDEAIAKGFRPRPGLNLVDQGGPIITDLVFTNFFVGGDAWDPSDMTNINESLSAAMSDQNLNNVLVQYFRGADNITSTFAAPTTLPGAAPASMSQSDVENLLAQLHTAGKLSAFDFPNSVFNFMLPRGTVLTVDDGSPDEGSARPRGAQSAEVEKESSSLNGLGGFHGSIHAGDQTLFYAVGVFSEGNNGIPVFDQSWKNVVATFYHELNEARTDCGVEDNNVAWVNNENPSEEIGDIPMTLAGAHLRKVMKEVPLKNGGTVPIQLMWSNAVSGPEGPVSTPRRPA